MGFKKMVWFRSRVSWVCLSLIMAGFLSGPAPAREGKGKKQPEGLLWPPGWVERVLKEAVLAHPGKNVVFSPLQVKLDFALFRRFSVEESRRRIDRFFGLGKMSFSLETEKKLLLENLREKIRAKDFGRAWRLSLASMVVPGPGTEVGKDFLDAVKGIQVGPPPEKTSKLKVPALGTGDLAWVSRMEFGALWLENFAPRNDEKGKFFSFRPGKEERGAWKDVVFLRYPGGRPCGYTGNLFYQAVSLELQGGFTFVVVLPREWKGLLEVLEKIGVQGRRRALRLEPQVMVDLFLPKFRALYENADFLSILRKGGLGGEPLFNLATGFENHLEAYLVRAGIEVEERGIKGFSTSILAIISSASMKYEVVKADRPFLFYLFSSKDKDDPLLAGVVFDPGKG